MLLVASVIPSARWPRTLEHMSEPEGKFSINRHFRREGVIQAAVFVAIILIGVVIAVVAPWIFGKRQ